MSRDLQDLIDGAIEEFKDRIADNPDYYRGGGEPHDDISEIADSSVPVYHSDLLELAIGDNELATSEPEIGPAFDGAPTPVNIIAGNVYEAIEAGLWEYWNENKDEITAERCCLCDKPQFEGDDTCECKCPSCGEDCFDDSTIQEHGMCAECAEEKEQEEEEEE